MLNEEEVRIRFGVDASQVQPQMNGINFAIENTMHHTMRGLRHLVGINFVEMAMKGIETWRDYSKELANAFYGVEFEKKRGEFLEANRQVWRTLRAEQKKAAAEQAAADARADKNLVESNKHILEAIRAQKELVMIRNGATQIDLAENKIKNLREDIAGLRAQMNFSTGPGREAAAALSEKNAKLASEIAAKKREIDDAQRDMTKNMSPDELKKYLAGQFKGKTAFEQNTAIGLPNGVSAFQFTNPTFGQKPVDPRQAASDALKKHMLEGFRPLGTPMGGPNALIQSQAKAAADLAAALQAKPLQVIIKSVEGE